MESIEPKRAARWMAHDGLLLTPDDAVECGWSRHLAEECFREVLGGRTTATVAEARALLEHPAALRRQAGEGFDLGSASAHFAEIATAFATLAAEMIDYRIERAEIARDYGPIRFTRVNLKRVDAGESGGVAIRALAKDLGWTLREDEEGVTVPIGELLPYFRRPMVRQLLDAKMAQCGLAAPAGAAPAAAA